MLIKKLGGRLHCSFNELSQACSQIFNKRARGRNDHPQFTPSLRVHILKIKTTSLSKIG